MLKTKVSVSVLSLLSSLCLLSSAKILHFSPLKQEKAVHPLPLLLCHLLFIFSSSFLSDRKKKWTLGQSSGKTDPRCAVNLDANNQQGFNNMKHAERLPSSHSPSLCLIPQDFLFVSFCLPLCLSPITQIDASRIKPLTYERSLLIVIEFVS